MAWVFDRDTRDEVWVEDRVGLGRVMLQVDLCSVCYTVLSEDNVTVRRLPDGGLTLRRFCKSCWRLRSKEGMQRTRARRKAAGTHEAADRHQSPPQAGEG